MTPYRRGVDCSDHCWRLDWLFWPNIFAKCIFYMYPEAPKNLAVFSWVLPLQKPFFLNPLVQPFEHHCKTAIFAKVTPIEHRSGAEEQMKEWSVRNSAILYINSMIPSQIPPGPRIYRNLCEHTAISAKQNTPRKKVSLTPKKSENEGEKKSLSSKPPRHVHFAKNQVQFGIFWPLEPHFWSTPPL